jgi:hypothetical protein
LGEDDFKTKSGKGRRNSGTYVTCLQFHGGFNSAFNGGIQVLKAGKIGKPQIFHERRGFGGLCYIIMFEFVRLEGAVMVSHPLTVMREEELSRTRTSDTESTVMLASLLYL